VSQKSYHINPSNSVFSKSDIKTFKKLTKKLNKTGEGDCACFYLKPVI